MVKKYFSFSAALLSLLFFVLGSSLQAQTYYARASGNWSTPSTWSTVGCGGAAATVAPGSADNVVICSGFAVTLIGSESCNNLEVQSGATLNLNINNFTVNGTTDLSGTITSGAGIVDHTFNGLITVNAGGNFDLDNPSNSNLSLGGGVINNGIFNTDCNEIYFTSSQTLSGANPINLDATNLIRVSSGVTVTNQTDVTVNVTNSPFNGQDATSTWVNAAGSRVEIQSGNTFMSTGNLDASALNNEVIYARSGTNNIKAATYYNLTAANASTKSLTGATVVLGNLSVIDATSFDLNGNNLTLHGDIINNSTLTGNTLNDTGTGTLNMVGSASQTIGGTTAGDYSIRNLTINKPSGNVILNDPLEVRGTVTMTSGKIITDATNILTLQLSAVFSGGSPASFVDGPVEKRTNSVDFTYAIGKGSTYAPIVIRSPSPAGSFMTAEFFTGTGVTPNPGDLDAGIDAIDLNEYWTINSTGNATVELLYDDSWRENDITAPADLRVAGYSTGDGEWNSESGVATGGSDATSGSVVTTANVAFSTVGAFTFGNAVGGANTFEPPVGLLIFDNGNGTNNWSDPLNWTTGAVPTASDDVRIDAAATIDAAALPLPNLGDLEIAGTGSLDLNGNNILVQNLLINGTLDASTGTPQINVAGDYTQNGIYTGNDATVTMTGSPVTIGGTATPNILFDNLTLSTGAAVTLANEIRVRGNLTLDGASLDVSPSNHDIRIEGNWENMSTYTFNPRSGTVFFEGSNIQTVGSFSSPTFHNITVNKTGGELDLASDFVTVTGTLNMVSGNILTDFSYPFEIQGTITGGSASSFIDGYVIYSGSGDVTVPVGDGSKYAPVGLANISAPTDIFIEYWTGAPFVNTINPPLDLITDNEYWQIGYNGTPTTVDISLHYNDDNAPESYVSDPANLRIAADDGSNNWSAVGSASGSGAPTGTITETGVTLTTSGGTLYTLGNATGGGNTFADPSACFYTLNMFDSFGDGWNGNTMDVRVNGFPVLDNVTFTIASSVNGEGLLGQEDFLVSSGASITTLWNGGGSFGGETSYTITDPNGIEVGSGAQTSITIPITANCPSCIAPTELVFTSASTSSLSFNWLASTTPIDDYQWVLVAPGDAPTSTTLASGTTSATGTTITGLPDNTAYDFYVKSNCGAGDESIWRGPVSAATECVPITSIPFTEEFELTSPTLACWEAIDNNNSSPHWEIAENVMFAQSGTRTATIQEDIFGGNDDYLILPPVTLTGDEQLSFYYQAVASEDTGFALQVRISTTGTSPSDFNTILLDKFYNTAPPMGGSSGWEEVNLSTYGGMTVYLAFYSYGSDDGGEGGGSEIYIDDVSIEPLPPCPRPFSVALDTPSVTATSAGFTWGVIGAATNGYEWTVVATGDSPSATAIANGTASATGTTATGLSANTTYDFYVRADCDTDGVSAWEGPVTFTTACDVITPPHIETFTTGVPPNCWEAADSGTPASGPSDLGSGSWGSDDFGNVGGASQAAKINLYSDFMEDWIISGDYDLSSGTFQLEYDFGVFVWNNTIVGTLGSDDEVQVLISTDGGSTWNTLITYDNTHVTSPGGDHEVIDLSAYSGIVRFAIWATDGVTNDPEDNDIMFDNFEVSSLNTCFEPTEINISEVSTSEANFAWLGTTAAYEWTIVPLGAAVTATAAASGTTTDTDATASGLSEATDYDFYVRGDCGGGIFSDWAGPFTFSTAFSVPEAPPGTRGIVFDGTDDYAVVSTILAPVFFSSDFSFSTWVKPYGESASGESVVFANEAYEIGYYNDGRVFVEVNGQRVETNSTLSRNDWTYLTVTGEKSGGTERIKIYMNGGLKKDEPDLTPPSAPATAYYFGAENGSTDFMHGQLDESRIWDDAIDGTAIRLAASSTSSALPNLFSYWRFDDATGQTASESLNGLASAQLGSTNFLDDADPLWAFRVRNTNDNGAGSLRAAMTDANSFSDKHFIDFSIYEPSPWVIDVGASTSTVLPPLSDATIIDGTTQPGVDSTRLVSLNATAFAVAPNEAGFEFAAGSDDSELYGMNIFNFSSMSGFASGIRVGSTPVRIGARGKGNVINRCDDGIFTDQPFTTIEGNKIGTGVSGTTALSSSNRFGIWVDGNAERTMISHNLISGNGNSGIQIENYNAADTLFITQNRIGTNVTGTGAVPNVNNGIWAVTSSGVISIQNNQISGNGDVGINLTNAVENTHIRQNFIGTNASGNAVLAGQNWGLFLGTGVSGTVIENNLISGNTAAGIEAIQSDNLTIRNNRIGTNNAGNAAIPNDAGVILRNGTGHLVRTNQIAGNDFDGLVLDGVDNAVVTGNIIGGTTSLAALPNNVGILVTGASATANQIGGTGSGQANIVAHNPLYGIIVESGAEENPIRRNRIFCNGGDGVALIGGNIDKAPPVIDTVTVAELDYTIRGAAAPNDIVELFLTDTTGACTTAQGARFIGQVTAGASGTWTYTFTAAASLLGNRVRATGTDALNNTSGFSNAFPMPPGFLPPPEFELIEVAGLSAPVQCGTSGRLELRMLGLSATGTYYVDINADVFGQFSTDLNNLPRILPGTTPGTLVLSTGLPEGTVLGPSIAVLEAESGLSSFISFRDTVDFLPRPRSNYTFRPTLNPISPDTATSFILENPEGGLAYTLLNLRNPADTYPETSLFSGQEELEFRTTTITESTSYTVLVRDILTECRDTLRDSTGVRHVLIEVIDKVSEADSLALVAIYNATNGPEWEPGWNLEDPIETWDGVSTFAGCITRLDLSYKGLSGVLPRDILQLGCLKYLNIAGNYLDFASMEFVILEAPTLDFVYAPQEPVYEPLDTIGNEGDRMVFETKVGGDNNLYQWFKDEEVFDQNGVYDSLVLDPLSVEEHLGVYTAEIRNRIATELILKREPITLDIIPQLSSPDSLWLVEFFQRTGGESWRIPWDLERPIRTWYGLEFRQGRLVGINLQNNQLSGQLPDIFDIDTVGLIEQLELLNLSGNNLEGALPPSLAQVSNLRYLDLSGNGFSGAIPEEYGRLTQLTTLWLSNNELTSLPDSIGWINLRNLLLDGNLLTSLPPGLQNAEKLSLLDISRNPIATLPESLCLSALRELYANQMGLGSLPDSLVSCSVLEVLELESNLLNSLPPSLQTLTSLRVLKLGDNLLEFGDLEVLVEVVAERYTYSPQPDLNTAIDTTIASGARFVMEVETTGEENRYQWYRDGVLIPGATGRSYTIPRMGQGDAGVYVCQVTNRLATELRLFRRQITVSLACQTAQVSIRSDATGIFCEEGNNSATLSVPEGDYTYQWFRDGTAIFGATQATYNTNRAGAYRVRLQDNNSGCQVFSSAFVLETKPAPAVLIRILDNATTLGVVSQDSLVAYQWYLDQAPIQGANTETLRPTASGDYFVAVTDRNGCTINSNALFFNVTGLEEEELAGQTRLYPNPTDGSRLFLELPQEAGKPSVVTLTDKLGRELGHLRLVSSSSFQSRYQLQGLQGLPVGVYYLRVQTDKVVLIKELLLE